VIRIVREESAAPPRREPPHPKHDREHRGERELKPDVGGRARHRKANHDRGERETREQCAGAIGDHRERVGSHHHQCPRGRNMRHRDRSIGACGKRSDARRRLVGVAERRERGKEHHQKPHDAEGGGRDESQVESGDDQHVRKPGQREPLAQRLVDTAAVANYQRAHLGAPLAGKIGVDKGADSRPDCGEIRTRKAVAMTDYRELRMRRRAEHHCRRDPLACKVGFVVELARVAEVARKAQHSRDFNFVAEANRHRRADDRQTDVAAYGFNGPSGRTGAFDLDEYVLAIGKLLRGLVDSSFEHDRLAVGEVADAIRRIMRRDGFARRHRHRRGDCKQRHAGRRGGVAAHEKHYGCGGDRSGYP